MANKEARRSASLLSVLFTAGFVWLLSSLISGPSFVAVIPGRTSSRTVMHSFRDDFEAWRSTLSDEEKVMIQNQAENEFNKKFRKSDDFKKDLPQDKIDSFGKILSKFFDAEAEDYKKDAATKTPDYDGLVKKANENPKDFGLKNKIIEVNRDADRRYNFATMKIREAESKGEKFPQSSPLTEKWAFQNNDTESHQSNLRVLEFMEKAKEDPNCPADAKLKIEEWLRKGIPPQGEPFELALPQVLVNQVHTMGQVWKKSFLEWGQNKTQAEVDAYEKDKVPEIAAGLFKFIVDKYVSARDEVEKDVENMKNFYRSQKDIPGKTKADVLKEMWEELPKYTEKPVPPLDEEMLAELAQQPATVEGEFRHSWGIADKLYKSEAVDAFGMKYLLGVFETKEEAKKAFADWNGEFENARVEMKNEMAQWGKQEQARMDKDTSGAERIKKVLEEARR